MNTKEANELLPSKPTQAIRDPARLKYLVIAQPKWGKTTFACGIPDMLLMATEEGHAFHVANKLIIDCWDYRSRADEDARSWGDDEDGNTHTSMVLAAEALESSDRYDLLAMDTADMGAKQCLDYHYDKKKIEHASDAGDWGRGWDVTLNQPFRKVVTRFLKSGRGMVFTSHLRVIEKKVGGATVSRFETTLPSGVQNFLHTQADLIIHGTFGKFRKGMEERDRIIVLDPSNEILAGSRVRGIYLPKRFIVDPKKPWEQWQGFFEDEDLAREADEEYADIYGKRRAELESEDEDHPDKPETKTTKGKDTKISDSDAKASKSKAATKANRRR